MKLSDLINELMEQLKQGDCDVLFDDGYLSPVEFVTRNQMLPNPYILLSEEYTSEGLGN